MGLLETYQDPGLDVDSSLSAEQVSAAEQERLACWLATVVACGAVPRRLSDANREELALDKRRARRVAHVLRQSLIAWGGKEREPTPEERSAGAQLDWATWAESCGAATSVRIRMIATWAKKTDNLRFGKSGVVRLVQEVEWMSYALRD